MVAHGLIKSLRIAASFAYGFAGRNMPLVRTRGRTIATSHALKYPSRGSSLAQRVPAPALRIAAAQWCLKRIIARTRCGHGRSAGIAL